MGCLGGHRAVSRPASDDQGPEQRPSSPRAPSGTALGRGPRRRQRGAARSPCRHEGQLHQATPLSPPSSTRQKKTAFTAPGGQLCVVVGARDRPPSPGVAAIKAAKRGRSVLGFQGRELVAGRGPRGGVGRGLRVLGPLSQVFKRQQSPPSVPVRGRA